MLFWLALQQTRFLLYLPALWLYAGTYSFCEGNGDLNSGPNTWRTSSLPSSNFLSPHIIGIMIGITVNMRLLMSNSNTLCYYFWLCNIRYFFFYFCPYFAWQQCFILVYNSFTSVGKFIHMYSIVFEIITNFLLYIYLLLFLRGVFSGWSWKIMKFAPFQL